MEKAFRKRGVRFFSLLASLCMMVSSVLPVYGAERKTYTYTVTFSAGNQGTLSIADGVSISVEGGGDYDISVTGDGKTVKITGLTAANHVRFLNSAVNLDSDSKYYVRGVRMGGRDNSTVDLSYFPVERDQDYVVAYGIKGNLVQYTINYVDQEGNELYPSQVYYGNIGDRPVVAYLYVEGYQPQAYNLTGTLQSDADRNIFTFVYRPIVVETPPVPAPETPVTPGITTPVVPGGTVPEAPVGPAVPEEEEPGGEGPGGEEPGPGPDVPDEQDIPDAPVPEDVGPGEPEEVRDINDQDVPMGNFDNEGTIVAANSARIRNTWIAAGIGILAVLILIAGVYMYRRMQKAGNGNDKSGKKDDR